MKNTNDNQRFEEIKFNKSPTDSIPKELLQYKKYYNL